MPLCTLDTFTLPWKRCPCVHWTCSHCYEEDSHVYTGHIHTAMGEMPLCTLDTFTLPWERCPCVHWTRSHCRGRDAHVYSGHVHTAMGEMPLCTVDMFTLLWEKPPLLVNSTVWALCTSCVVSHFLLNELTTWYTNTG